MTRLWLLFYYYLLVSFLRDLEGSIAKEDYRKTRNLLNHESLINSHRSQNTKHSAKKYSKNDLIRSIHLRNDLTEADTTKIIQKCVPQQCSKGVLCQGDHFTVIDPTNLYRNSWIAQMVNFPSPGSNHISCDALQKPVAIGLVTTWVSEQQLHRDSLNQFLYAQSHQYRFFHFTSKPKKYHQTYHGSIESVPLGWSSVEYIANLLKDHPEIDYFFKLDQDCLIYQSHLLLESFLDPFHQYAFYLTHIEQSRFIQSHLWIIQNSPRGEAILHRWLEFRQKGHCADIAQEQGALNLLVGRLMKESRSTSTSEYTCDQQCHLSFRSAYKHHHCVLDWYEDNQLNVSFPWNHPEIFIYPYSSENRRSFLSPRDGITVQLSINQELPLKIATDRKEQDFRPFTIHPCKKFFYGSPEEVQANLSRFC